MALQPFGEHRDRKITITAAVAAEIDLVHVCVLRDDRLLCAGHGKYLGGNGGQRRNRRDLEACAVGQTLRNRCCDTQTDE